MRRRSSLDSRQCSRPRGHGRATRATPRREVASCAGAPRVTFPAFFATSAAFALSSALPTAPRVASAPTTCASSERRDDALDRVHAPRRRSSTAFLELLKRQRAVPRGNGANAEGWWRGPPSHGPVTARVRPACVTRVRMLSNLDTPGGSQGVCPHAATYGAGNGGSVVRQTAARAGAADRRHGAPDQAAGAPDLKPPTKIRDRLKFRGDPGRQN